MSSGKAVIQIRVRGVSALRSIIGRDTVVTLKNGSTIRDLVTNLERNFGTTYKEVAGEELSGSIMRRFSMLLNGVFMSPEQNVDMKLNDGDEIVFFQLAGG